VIVVAFVFGCGAERFNGADGAAKPEPMGSGGAGVEIDGGTGTTGTGGAGSGGDIGAGSGGGSGGGSTGTGGGGGSTSDSASDLPSSADGGLDPTSFTDAGLSTDTPTDGSVCSGNTKDLSSLGTGDFTISFHIQTTQTGWVALLNQRSVCLYGMFWDIRQSGTGTIFVETDDNAVYQSVESTIKINDGKPHDVGVARLAGTLTIVIDGAPSGQGPSSAALGSLPALRTGNDVCTAPGSNPLTAMFAGTTLSQVCITRS
jgi:hypothetical protein